jgi:uncharacterized protein YbjT (DUF2867 family)
MPADSGHDQQDKQMNITVFGATGRIGEEVARQALLAGHRVTAVVRNAGKFALADPALTVVTVPGLTDAEALRPAVRGADVVISGVGPRGPRDGPVATTSTKGILGAMEAEGIRRFVAVSAVPVGPVPRGESFFNRFLLLPLMGTLLKDLYADLTTMEDAIMHSATEWTIVRPPKLISRPLSGKYRTAIGANVPRGYLVSRADVAHAMLAAVGNLATVRQAVGVAD